jgi:hypothetical protein
VLAFLVTSKARRRLLLALWVDGSEGTASSLARRVYISFASAYRELRAMHRWQLVITRASDDGIVYAANRAHPDADAMITLFRPEPRRMVDDHTRDVRAHLAAHGSPVRSHAPSTRSPPFDQLVASGVELARRDPDVARGMPVFLYRNREAIASIVGAAGVRPIAHRLGFFLALTGRLSGDAWFDRIAASLRDHRVKRQDLFDGAAFSSSNTRSFRLARAWGFQVRADLQWFQTLFDKFVRH